MMKDMQTEQLLCWGGMTNAGVHDFLVLQLLGSTFGAASFVVGHFGVGLLRSQTILALTPPDFPQNFLHFSCI